MENLVVQELLKEVPNLTREQYKSHLQLHLKQILTQLSKSKIESTIMYHKKYQSCKLRCYNKFDYVSFDAEKVPELTRCVNNCREPMGELNQFLDNINFLSKKKFKGCSAACYQSKDFEDQLIYKNRCLWDCYNRLDKRYVKYWYQQRTKLMDRYADVLKQ